MRSYRELLRKQRTFGGRMKLDELYVIQMLKDFKYIKDENDIAELKIDEGNIYLKLNSSLEYASMDIEVSE